jgi:hypothetical protein
MRGKALAGLFLLLTCGPMTLAQVEPAPGAAPRRPVGARLANAAEVRKRLGLAPEYDNVRGVQSLKVAVLDYGFAGLDGGRRYLPEGAVLVEHYDPEFVRRFKLGDPDFRKPLDPANPHGRLMAQIIWAVTGSQPKGPQFYLLNANGPTMLRRAVRYAIEQKVDIILFSAAFEGAGNGDGRGPINRVVDEALAADIIWINAAGNYGRRVYNGPVRVDRDGYLRFRDGPDGTTLRFRNRLDENTITVTLTWNDYRDEEDAGTAKDLDLYVEDPEGRRVGASQKTQVSGDRAAGPDESRNPRERVVLTDLPADADRNYRIRVRARTNNFGADDRIRVLVTSSRETYVHPGTGAVEDALTFFDATGKGELHPPADNPRVVTVGDSSPASAVGPTADHRVKPDVILPDSRAFFTDGEVTSGSSNAAAYFAGVAAVLRAAEPGLRTRHILRLARPEPPALRAGAPRASATDRAPSTTQSPPRTPSGGRVVLVGPRGRVLVIDYPNRTPLPSPTPSMRPSVPSVTGRTPELLPPPEPKVTSSEPSTTPEKREWRTPGRTRLAEVVRADR